MTHTNRVPKTPKQSPDRKREQGYKTTERKKSNKKGRGERAQRRESQGTVGECEALAWLGLCHSLDEVRSRAGQGHKGASQGPWDGG